MNKEYDLSYDFLCLVSTAQVGYKTFQALMASFGSVANIYEQDVAILSRIVNTRIASAILKRESKVMVEQMLAWVAEAKDRHLITLHDKLYPQELKMISSPPLLFFAHGNIDLLSHNKLAVVGTRHPSTQGIENAYQFGRSIANNDLTVVSGMALGVDRHAHLGSLKGKDKSIGVIGTGIDVRYPKSNNDLYDNMLVDGLLISEFFLGTQPLVPNFPRRNRIIAGLSLGCLVIESGMDGGSLITANLALEMGREVMAIPSSIHNPMARGCHKLIKNGAKLVEYPNDIFEELIIPKKIKEKDAPKLKSVDDELSANNLLIKSENKDTFGAVILNKMGYDPISIDKLCVDLKINFSEICAKLLSLELDGLIINCGGGCYQRIFR